KQREEENEFAWLDKIPDVTKKDEQKKELKQEKNLSNINSP
ncbi:unnamed protein product, partial [marine sediment metagenome]